MPDIESDIITRGRVFIQALMSGPGPLPLVSACAVGGNGWQENLLRPLTLGAKDHGSDGIMQWRLGRLTELQHLPNWDTLPVQAQFFKAECQRDYPRLWADLVAGKKSLETLTANVMVQYERPNLALAGLDHRITYAHALLNHMNTLTPIVTVPVTQPTEAIMDPAIISLLIQFLPAIIQGILTGIANVHAAQTGSPHVPVAGASAAPIALDSLAPLLIKELQTVAPDLLNPTSMAELIAKELAKVIPPKVA
jgi:hypothetical protein